MNTLVFVVSVSCWVLIAQRYTISQYRSLMRDIQVMRLIDEIYTRCPFYGSRRIASQLSRDQGEPWNRKRIQRLMRIMGMRGVAPGPDTSTPHPENKVRRNK